MTIRIYLDGDLEVWYDDVKKKIVRTIKLDFSKSKNLEKKLNG